MWNLTVPVIIGITAANRCAIKLLPCRGGGCQAGGVQKCNAYCLMLLVTSTAQAAIGHAKHGSNSCRVGRGQRVLSMCNV